MVIIFFNKLLCDFCLYRQEWIGSLCATLAYLFGTVMFWKFVHMSERAYLTLTSQVDNGAEVNEYEH